MNEFIINIYIQLAVKVSFINVIILLYTYNNITMFLKLLNVSLLYIFDKCVHDMCKIQILIWFADSLVNKVITKIPFRGFLGEKNS